MSVARAFGTSVSTETPTDPTQGGTKIVSDFITVSSLTNFSAMTGAIAAAWGGARQLSHSFDGKTTPFVLCVAFAIVSLLASSVGKDPRKWGPAVFIAAVNTMTLFGAVVSATAVVATDV